MTTILEHIAEEVGKQIKAERESQGGNLTADINTILSIIKNGGSSTEVVAENLNGQPYMTHSTASSSTLTGVAGAIITHPSIGGFQSSRLIADTLPVWDRTSTTNPSFLDHLNDQGKMLNKTFEKTHVITIQNNGTSDVFYIDDRETPTLEIAKGNKYVFDWSDDLTNPFRLSEISDGTNSTGIEHTSGVVIDLANGTTTFTIDDDEVDQLFYYSDVTAGIGGEINLKQPPYHISMNDGHVTNTIAQNSVGLLVNMLKEGVSRRTAPTGKVLYICDTPPSDYQFYARSGFIQFQLEMASYWAGLTLEVPSGTEVVTRQPSYFYNAQYNHSAYNTSWFLGDHYGFIEHDQFFKNNTTLSSVSDWKQYFNDYDCVVVLGISKTAWFPRNVIKGLSKARDENSVGLLGLTDDSYYTRNINTIFAPYNISWQGRFSQTNTTDHFLVSELKGQGYNHNYLFDGLHDDYHLTHSITDSFVAINETNGDSNITINLQIDQLRDELTAVDEYSPAVDREYRNLTRSLLFDEDLPVKIGDIYTISDLGRGQFIFRNPNNIYRYLSYADQLGEGGDDVYERIGTSAPIGDEYDQSLSNIGTGWYGYTGSNDQVRILKNGDFTAGWVDVDKIRDDIQTLESVRKSTDADLPLPYEDGEIIWVSDQSFHVYSKDGDWYKLADDTLWKDMPTRDIDLFLMLGQSNMHGHADLAGASTDITDTQSNVLFKTAWHDNTSIATTELYESDWVNGVTAGSTRGDDGVSTIGGSSKFGPEIGFVHEGKTNGLFGTNTPAIFKYAVGASTLFSDSATNGGLSDWDTSANLVDKNGDCWRGYKTAFANAVQELKDKGHNIILKDVIWHQGESDGAHQTPQGTIASKLKVLWDEIRGHMGSINLDYTNLNLIITRISGANGEPVNWGDEYKRMSDQFSRVGLVDSTIYSPGNSIHIDQTGMFGIGKAFAREAKRINFLEDHSDPHEIPGTDLLVGVSSTESNVTTSSGSVTQIDDLSANGYNFTAETASSVQLVESGSDLLYNEKVFKCDGDVDVLDTGNVTGMISGNKITTFMLFEPTSVTGGQDAPFSFRDFNSFDIIVPLSGSSSVFRGQFYHHTRTEGVIIYTGSLSNPMTGYNLLTWEIDTTAQTSTGWLNGTQIFSGADSGNFGPDQIIHLMGNHNAPAGVSGNAILDGKFTEFIVTQDNSDREEIEGAIMHKYGLARNLPSGHSYKQIVP